MINDDEEENEDEDDEDVYHESMRLRMKTGMTPFNDRFSACVLPIRSEYHPHKINMESER